MTVRVRVLIYLIILLAGSSLSMAQSPKLNAIHDQMKGTWLCKGDSISELVITADSITNYRFRLNGVTSCSYKLVQEPCEKLVKFPSATGVYIVEHFKGRDACCALAAVSATSLKIIYPDGTECTYSSEKSMQK